VLQRWSESDVAEYKARRAGKLRPEPGTRKPSSKKKGYSKYRAVRTEVGDRAFASKKEARRYEELLLLERAGKISNLTLQVKFSLDVEGVHICNYYPDFCFDDEHGNVVVEDVKSKPTRTPVYKLKKRLMFAIYRIRIEES